MKLNLLLVCLFFICIPVTLAQVEISFLKDNYIPGEILQAEIQILEQPISEINLDNIFVYGPLGEKVDIGFILVDLEENNSLLYAPLPKNLKAGIYNLTITNLYYKPHNILEKKEVSKSFEIVTNGTLLTIDPPYFKIDPAKIPEELSIKIQNLDTKSVSVEATSSVDYIYPIRNSITLNPGEQKRLFLSLDPKLFEEGKVILNLTYDRYYQVPFYSIKKVVPITPIPASPTPTITPEKGLIFATDLTKIIKTISRDEQIEGTIPIKNELNKTLYNITVDATGNLEAVLSIQPEQLDSLDSYQTSMLIINLNSNLNALEGLYEGNLIIQSGIYSDELPLSITIAPSKVVTPPPPTKTPTVAVSISPSPSSTIQQTTTERKIPLLAIFILVAIIIIFILIFYLIGKQDKRKTFKEYIKAKKP